MAEKKFFAGPGRVAVRAAEDEARAREIATELGLRLITGSEDEAGADAVLVVRKDRLELREAAEPGSDPSFARSPRVSCEFVSGSFGHRIRSGHVRAEMLIKAVRGKTGPAELKVVDGTAGLGRDALLLALAGFETTAIERSPVMAALLRDGLQRSIETGGELADAVQQRLRVIVADARDWLTQLQNDDRPDVVVLDPMFPTRDKSALVKKEMRLCRLVSGDDTDAADLLAAARRAARRRVVVKRPTHASPLANTPPTTTRQGKSVRFDIYV